MSGDDLLDHGRRELEKELDRLLPGMGRVAMEYSPEGALQMRLYFDEFASPKLLDQARLILLGVALCHLIPGVSVRLRVPRRWLVHGFVDIRFDVIRHGPNTVLSYIAIKLAARLNGSQQ